MWHLDSSLEGSSWIQELAARGEPDAAAALEKASRHEVRATPCSVHCDACILECGKSQGVQTIAATVTLSELLACWTQPCPLV